MGAVRTQTKEKMGIKCPSEVLVLFRDRMVTNFLMKLRGLYYKFSQKSKEKEPVAKFKNGWIEPVGATIGRPRALTERPYVLWT